MLSKNNSWLWKWTYTQRVICGGLEKNWRVLISINKIKTLHAPPWLPPLGEDLPGLPKANLNSKSKMISKLISRTETHWTGGYRRKNQCWLLSSWIMFCEKVITHSVDFPSSKRPTLKKRLATESIMGSKKQYLIISGIYRGNFGSKMKPQ